MQRYLEFYEENKEIIDKHLLPIISGNIIGGRHMVMYKKWAWNLAGKMQAEKLFPILSIHPLFDSHINDDDGVPYIEWRYQRIESAFLMLGQLILENVYHQTLATYHFPLDEEDK